MKESIKKKWVPMVGAFVAVFGSFAALMYLSISTFSTSATNQNQPTPSFFRFPPTDTAAVADRSGAVASRTVETAPGPSGWSKKVLRLGRESQVGKIFVTYRGKQGRSTFRLDVVIPELDPQYTYLRQFNIENARKGFQVGAERFVLLSAGSTKIRFKHYQVVP